MTQRRRRQRAVFTVKVALAAVGGPINPFTSDPSPKVEGSLLFVVELGRVELGLNTERLLRSAP